MSQTMADILAQALANIRQREAFRLNWRVIGTSDGVPFDSDHEFFYLNGHDDKGKPYGKPNYPVPALYFNRAYVTTEGARFSYNPRNPWWLSH